MAVEKGGLGVYVACMTLGLMTTPGPGAGSPETMGERARRIEREAKILTQAERDIDAGLGSEDDEMEHWLAELDRTDPTHEPLCGPAERV